MIRLCIYLSSDHNHMTRLLIGFSSPRGEVSVSIQFWCPVIVSSPLFWLSYEVAASVCKCLHERLFHFEGLATLAANLISSFFLLLQ